MKDSSNGRPGMPDRATVGKIGEETACKYLKTKGFSVLERNYWKKWGEIDVVAVKDSIYHFVEVKTVIGLRQADDYQAEDNIHPWKVQRLLRAIQTYCLERKLPDEQAWQVDAVTVELDFETRRARVKLLEDIS